MARNAPNFSELANAPSLCKDKAAPYFRIDAVEVRAPYKGVDQVAVPVVGVINADDPTAIFELFAPLEDTLEDQGEGTLGWESQSELDLLVDVIAEAQDVADAASEYDIDGAQGVANMAKQAEAILGQIADTYQNFRDNVVYTIKQGDDTISVTFPLSVHEEDFEPEPGFSSVAALDATRIQARANIVKWWDYGLSLLWCSQIGLAQLESFTGNKKQGGIKLPGDTGPSEPTTPGGGLSLAPSDPGPEPDPGGGFAPSFPDPGEPDPGEPESEPPSTDPRPEPGSRPGGATSSSGGGGGAAIGAAVAILAILALRK